MQNWQTEAFNKLHYPEILKMQQKSNVKSYGIDLGHGYLGSAIVIAFHSQ